MPIDNIPELYFNTNKPKPNLFVYDLKMTEDSIKTKVNLNMHMFSFLQTGKKQVHFANTSAFVNNNQSILIKKGNCLWSELLDKDTIYFCKLFFFSEENLKEFLNKQMIKSKEKKVKSSSFFTIDNDEYLGYYFNSLTTITNKRSTFSNALLSIKFEELLMYLLSKYGARFENYLISLVTPETSSFKKSIEQNIFTPLSLEEIAFLCNMSLSTFKRHFLKEYNISPGKWFREQRLLKAKELLEQGNLTSSDIYLNLGYNNLSNFSNAFKTRFGINPTQV
ncbi:Helix-turn-helix transcriptional regulator [Tenacibaculum sp. 190524A02b]|uniref:AraC family transcriptional regulator, exoenzyme S synthesis regulatory protein ExsA n=1 Tax=Tenacibaculum vairaonense TaxID=3137860 RepID=A0ABP1F8T8_9FLAO